MTSIPSLTSHEFDVVLRQDLATFTERAFLHLNPATPYQPNWHIDVIAAKLRDCLLGKTRRLIINLPPRHTKSIAASIAFPAWLLGHQPSAEIVAVSYAQELANKHSQDCRAIMESDWYQRVFTTRLSATRNAVPEFTTTERGFRMATSIGGTLTGRGGDFIIIDDPIKPEDAVSESMRKRANDWYDGTLYSRQNCKSASCIIVIMHRLHEDDLVGHILGQEPWEVVSFPAIAEVDQAYAIDTPWGPRTHTRSAGDILHPARESAEALAHTRATIGEYNYAGQYQQAPAPLGGGMVKLEWFKRYRDDDRPARFDQILCSWDTGSKPTELADYSACTTWGIKEGHAYLLNAFRRKMNYPDLKRAVATLAAAHKATVILIEDKASGTQLIQELRNQNVPGVQGYEPKGDKVMRLHAQCATIESGFVHVPESAPWLAEYLHEITTFPAAKHDDQVDSTSQALEWIKVGQKGMGLFYFYQRLYEQLQAEQRG